MDFESGEPKRVTRMVVGAELLTGMLRERT
jgi:hypothetical protein